MDKILEIINQIKNTSSRNDKERILEENKNNELLIEIFKFVYDPYILTGISSKKINKKIKASSAAGFINSISDLMKYLEKNNTGTDCDILEVKWFIENEPSHLHELYIQIATKSLKIGITDSTLNKIYGSGFIKSFDVMLAKKFDEHKHKIKGNFVITKKLDGNRLVVIKENGVVKSFTRTGNQYEGLEQIESEIQALYLDNIVFDGELIADAEGSTHEIYAETTSKARSKGSNKTGLMFHIFDCLSLSDFQNGKSRENCINRKNFLTSIFQSNEFKYCIEVKPLYIGNNLSEVDQWMQHASEHQWEGLMVNMDTPYVCKRTDTILKVKSMLTCDLKVVGFEKGTGRNVGRLGALIVDYKGFSCGVGSGFSDYDRDYIWKNQSEYLGKIVEVKYFEESKNQDGGLSLRFPIYKRLRTDKTEESYN
jgi:DNA ligase-1